MYRSLPICALLFAAALIAGCGDDDNTPTTPTDPPTAITEQFGTSDTPLTLTPNGGVTHAFAVQRAGDVTARIDSLEPADAVIGISLGPMSVQACSAAVARDNATTSTTIIGTASGAGNFCLRVYDAAGTLTAPVAYRITVQHF